jgi:hypothetical protein
MASLTFGLFDHLDRREGVQLYRLCLCLWQPDA